MIRAAPLALLASALAGCTAGCTSGRVSPKGANATVVTIAPTDVSVGVGGTVAFTGTVTGTSNTATRWSVTEPAGCGSVSPAGVYSAPPDPAICHVVVASAADTQKTATAKVTVTGPPPATFSLSPDPATVSVNATQQFTVSPSAAVTWSVVQTTATAAPVFPLALSANGRYVVDASARPWRIQADAAWFISALATPAQVDTYLATRKAQGFNAFYFMAMVHPGGYPSVPNAPNNNAGVAPFTTSGNFLTPNEPYWAWIDSVVDKAAAQGMVVMFAYNYLGYPGLQQGWENEVSAMSQADAAAWGTWLGNRYKARPNIIWFALGDQTPPSGSTMEQNCLATISAIKAAGATQLFMAEPMGGNSNPIMDAPAFASVLDLNSYYGYGPTGQGDLYPQADRAYRGVAPPKPVWVQEGGYEYEDNAHFCATKPCPSYQTRRTRFWSVLAGGTAGDGFGSRDAYQWISFPNGLGTPGAAFSQIAFELFASLPWWDLLPSGTGTGFAGKTLVTSGGGTNGGLDWVTSAVTSSGSHLLAYIPTTGATTPRTITIDLTAMKGPAQASWWDPASGAKTVIGTFANTGAQAFTSPGANAGGQNDWVLLLDAAGMGPCGSISGTGLYTAPAAVPIAGDCRVRAALQSDPTSVAYARVIVR